MKTTGQRITIVTGAFAIVVLALAAWRGWPQIRFRYLFEPIGRNERGLLECHRQPLFKRTRGSCPAGFTPSPL